jgi:hypothetical protein
MLSSCMLAANITGHPMFLNDPTYPHDGVITLSHCTAQRRLDGKTLEPVRFLTQFESDYGAAPKVEMKVGQAVTNIIADFAGKRWLGFLGMIVDAPFLPICRSQIDVAFSCDSERVAELMPGFHWMTVSGDYRRKVTTPCGVSRSAGSASMRQGRPDAAARECYDLHGSFIDARVPTGVRACWRFVSCACERVPMPCP